MHRAATLLTLGISLALAPLACAFLPTDVEDEPPSDTDDVQTQDPINTASTSLRSGECPSESPQRGLQIPSGHRATTLEQWDGLPYLQALANRSQQPLGGRTRGLLVSITYFNGDDCRKRDARVEYTFSNAAGTHHALYFPSTGAGYNFLRDWIVPLPEGGSTQYDAAMFGPSDGLPCLHACAHFVELEVNDGRGGVGLHFVATAVEVIDDQRDIDPARVLDELRERFAETVDEQHGDLRRLYADGQREAPKLRLGDRVDEPPQLWPSWSEPDATLEVLAFSRGRAVGSQKVGSETIPPSDCPPGAPCAYREVGTFDLFDELTITHELAATYRVDARGTLVEERIYAPRVQISQGQTRRRR
jgi:hypothetical protein